MRIYVLVEVLSPPRQESPVRLILEKLKRYSEVSDLTKGKYRRGGGGSVGQLSMGECLEDAMAERRSPVNRGRAWYGPRSSTSLKLMPPSTNSPKGLFTNRKAFYYYYYSRYGYLYLHVHLLYWPGLKCDTDFERRQLIALSP